MPFDTIEQGLESLRDQAGTDFQIEENTTYIPLLGKRFSRSEDATDLDVSVRDFTSDTNSKRTCVLYGESGAGKSFFLQQFTLKLWGEYTSQKPIPLFISLPLLADPIHRAVEESLEKKGFNQAQIAELKTKHSFIFAFDGYDEIHQLENLYVTNRLHAWNAKTIISCRTQYFYNKSHSNLYFMPLQDEREQPHLLQTLYVASFNQDQIENYLSAMRERGVIIPSYAEITKIPGLRDIITTPFLLQLTVEALPEILARYSASSSSSSSSSVSISSEERQRLTQTNLYKSFLHRWFLRQENKLKMSGHITPTMPDQKPIFWRYCQTLALKMHEHNIIWLNTQDPTLEVYFEHDIETERLRSSCPLKTINGKIGFWHQSLGAHFVSQTIYNEAMQESVSPVVLIPTTSARSSSSNPEQERPKGTIHLRLITDDPAALRGLADDIETDTNFKKRIFDVIECSKTNKHYAVGAANAISALNVARVSFSGFDFSQIQVPYANLNHGLFDNTRFDHAQLSNVNLQGAYIRNASFKDAMMSNVNFGERPAIKLSTVIQKCAYSQNGNWLVVVSGPLIFLYDAYTHDCIWVLTGHADEVTCCAFSYDSRYLVTGGLDKIVQVLSLPEGRQVAVLADHRDVVKSVACSPNSLHFISAGGHLFSREGDSDIRLCDVETGVVIRKFFGHHRLVNSLVFSPDGEYFASASQDKSIKIWSISNTETIKTLQNPGRGELRAVAFLSHHKQFVSAGDDCTIRLWSLEVEEPIRIFSGHTKQIFSIAVSPDGNTFATAGNDKTIRLWSVETGKQVDIFEGHQALVNCVAFAPNGQELASVSGSHQHLGELDDNSLRFWSVNQADNQKKGNFCHANKVRSIIFSPDFKLIASGSLDGTLALWDAETGANKKLFQGSTDWVRTVAYSADGKYLASGGGNKLAMLGAPGGGPTVRVWSVETGQIIRNFEAHQCLVQSLVFSPDNRYLASTGDLSIKLWDVNTGLLVKEFEGHSNMISSIVFSKDGALLISAGTDARILAWNVQTGEIVKSFAYASSNKNQTQINCVTLNSNGKLLALASENGQVTICHFLTNEMKKLGQQEKASYWVAFSPDDVFLASGGQDGYLYIWNVSSVQLIEKIFLNSAINSICWKSSQNNFFVATAHDDKSIRFYSTGLSGQFFLTLFWVTYQSALMAENATIERVRGLSRDNIQLLKQLNCIGDPIIDAQNIIEVSSGAAQNKKAEEQRNSAEECQAPSITESVIESNSRSSVCCQPIVALFKCCGFFQSERSKSMAPEDPSENMNSSMNPLRQPMLIKR